MTEYKYLRHCTLRYGILGESTITPVQRDKFTQCFVYNSIQILIHENCSQGERSQSPTGPTVAKLQLNPPSTVKHLIATVGGRRLSQRIPTTPPTIPAWIKVYFMISIGFIRNSTIGDRRRFLRVHESAGWVYWGLLDYFGVHNMRKCFVVW